MIAAHARLARALAEQLGLPDEVRGARRRLTSSGTATGGRATWRARGVPLAARIAQLAEFVEVAHRVGGVEAAKALARKRSGKQFDPALAALLCVMPADSRRPRFRYDTWDAVIEAEPALAVVLSGDGIRRGAAGDRELRRPQVALHARAFAGRRRARGRRRRRARSRRPDVRRCGAPGLVHGFGRLGVSNSIWDKPGPLGAGEWERVRMHPYLTERMLHQSEALAPLGAIAVAAPRAPRRLGLSARAVWRARSHRPGRRSSPRPTPTRRCASRAPTALPLSADEAAA